MSAETLVTTRVFVSKSMCPSSRPSGWP